MFIITKTDNQGQTRILSTGSFPASVTDLPQNACYHIKSIRFFSYLYQVFKSLLTGYHEAGSYPAGNPAQAANCQTPIDTYTDTQSKCKYQCSTYSRNRSWFIYLYQYIKHIQFYFPQPTQLTAHSIYCVNKSPNTAIPLLFV